MISYSHSLEGRQKPSINYYNSVDAKQLKLFFFLNMYGCPEEGIGSPGSGVTDGCELRCGCWESSLDLLEKQKHSSSPQLLYFLNVYLEAKVTELLNIQSWILRCQLVSILK